MTYTPHEVARCLRQEIDDFLEVGDTYLQPANEAFLRNHGQHPPNDSYRTCGCALGKLYLIQHPEVTQRFSARIYEELSAFIPFAALEQIERFHCAGLRIAQIAEGLDACDTWEDFAAAADYCTDREVIV